MRLAAASPQALAIGLLPGLPLADARARVPCLVAANHEPEADAVLLGQVAEYCDRWTPTVALDPPDGLVLDVTGCDHLWKNETALRQDAASRLRGAGLHLRATIAGTPDAARALTRFTRHTTVPPGEEMKATRPLPVAALDLPSETGAALSLAGLKRIADLLDVPSCQLSARFGDELGTQLRRVTGQEVRPLDPLRPPPIFHAEQVFADPVAHASTVDAALDGLVHRIGAILESREQGGRSFEASFFRSDGAVRRIRIETGRPSRDPGTIMRLLRTRFDALADPLDPGFGFDLVRLCVLHSEPLRLRQRSAEGDLSDEDALSDLVDRLVARLGPKRVLRFATADTHDPLRASRPVSATAEIEAHWAVPQAGDPPLRPLQLFCPPHPIEAVAEVPDGPPMQFRWRHTLHRVVGAEGPERIAPEWWRDPHATTRDYYRLEDAEGHRFWVFREGLYGNVGETPRWFLHGLFA